MAPHLETDSWNRYSTISYVHPLPVDFVDAAAALYLSALADKLVPLFGTGRRARQALAAAFERRLGIAAVDHDRLVGILGIQVEQIGFMNVRLSSLTPHYGCCSSLWRLALLSVLHYAPHPDEAYIDGVAVSPAYRGRCIGTGLIRSLEAWARGQGLSMLSLEVVDSNPKARRLYDRIGFQTVQEKSAWPIGSFFGFQSSVKMVKQLR